MILHVIFWKLQLFLKVSNPYLVNTWSLYPQTILTNSLNHGLEPWIHDCIKWNGSLIHRPRNKRASSFSCLILMFVVAKGSFAATNPRVSSCSYLERSLSFVVANCFTKASVSLHYGEPKSFILFLLGLCYSKAFPSQWRTALPRRAYPLAAKKRFTAVSNLLQLSNFLFT